MLKRFKDLEGNKECSLYNLINFNPVIFNEEFLRNIKIYGDISQTAVQGLINGSKKFRKIFDSQKLTPNKDYSLVNYSGEPFPGTRNSRGTLTPSAHHTFPRA